MCTIILATVNYTPKELYTFFEKKFQDEFPIDQPQFIELLEREGIIGEKKKRIMNKPNQPKAVLIALILQEIETSLSDSDEKFYKLLSVMKEYKHGLETLAHKIEKYLDPGTYLCTYKVLQCMVECKKVNITASITFVIMA